MKSIRKILLSIALLTASFAGAQEDSLRISLLTCSPGASVYEVYGHSGIRVQNLTTGQDLIFNYGLFDFSSPHFVWRFLLGQTDYWLGAQYADGFLREYGRRGSYVYEQELALTQEQARKLHSLLLENYLPENRTYRYNFFYNNCSTMARDIIEKAIEGGITYSDTGSGNTLRDVLHQFNMVQPWGSFGEDLLIGSEADGETQGRTLEFCPQILMEHFSEASISDGNGGSKPLVRKQSAIVVPQNPVTFKSPLLNPLQASVIFLLAIILISAFDWYLRRSLYITDFILLTLQGAAGLLICFMFFFSEHPGVGSNWLVIPFNPLPLICLPLVVIKAKRKRIEWCLIADALLLILFLAFSWAMPQQFQWATLIIIAAMAIRFSSTAILSVRNRDRIHYRNKNASVAKIILPAMLLSIPLTADAQKPKLVVGIVIDGLDSRSLDRISPLLSNQGIVMLRDNGYVRTQVSQQFDGVERASAVASVYTGTVPFYHGIVADKWMDRKTRNITTATEDHQFKGINTMEDTSPAKLLVTNLADEMKISSDGLSQICAIAVDRDAAVLSGGHEADAVIWLNDEDARWSSSLYYSKKFPHWADSLNSMNREQITWKPSLELDRYLGSSIRAFHHQFRSNEVLEVKTSPTANDMVTRAALAAIKGMQLGKDQAPDLLALTYRASGFKNDYPNPETAEYQDLIVRLDKGIAQVIKAAREAAKDGPVLIFLTTTGSRSAKVPELTGSRIPTGSVSMERVTALLNLYLSAMYEQGQWIETYHNNSLFLNQKLMDSKRIPLHQITEDCIDFLTQVTGVKNVLAQRDLMTGTIDKTSERIRNGFNSTRSGDILLEINPGWTLTDELCGTTLYVRPSANTFPVYLWGAGVRNEVSHEPIDISFLAPTISDILGISVPNACQTEPLPGIR